MTQRNLSSQRPSDTKKGTLPSWKGALNVNFTFLIRNLRLSPKESLWRDLGCSREERGRKGFFCPKDRPTQGNEGKHPWKGFLKIHFTFVIWNLRLSPKESLWRALAYSRDEKESFVPKIVQLKEWKENLHGKGS